MGIKSIITAIALFATSCSHIYNIPVFPQCKILKVSGFPVVVIPRNVYHYRVWTNTAVDSVRSTTYFYRDMNKVYPLLIQSGKMIHDDAPVSGIEFDWMTSGAEKFILEIEAWNRYDSDEFYFIVEAKEFGMEGLRIW